MKRIVELIAAIMITLVFSGAGIAAAGESETKLRVGTFDSRAVALAFWRGPDGMEIISELQRELKQARAAGKEKRVAELEIELPGLQVRLHQQVFSSGSVTDVIGRISDRLPDIAEEAGVAIIVPKWNVAWQGKVVEVVDVTDRLVACFNPSEQVLQMIKPMAGMEPVPIEELSMDPSH
jgi:hypothetical protein